MTKSLTYWVFLLLFLPACVTPKHLRNFNEGDAFPSDPFQIANEVTIEIQKDDVLSINVQGIDEETVKPFSPVGGQQQRGGNAGGQNAQLLDGYLVDSKGYINFPVLGLLQVEGKTTEKLRQELEEKIGKYVKDPIINVRFLNFKVVILGEVAGPGVFTFQEERISIIEAIGNAGGITNVGKRDNILIIREQNGQREFGRISLHEREVFESPYFFVKQNDIIYVEPHPAKAYSIADPTSKVAPWLGLIASVIALSLTIFR